MSILCKVKAEEKAREGMVPTGHKQRHAAQGDSERQHRNCAKAAFVIP
jgi:hypothetical protein